MAAATIGPGTPAAAAAAATQRPARARAAKAKRSWSMPTGWRKAPLSTYFPCDRSVKGL